MNRSSSRFWIYLLINIIVSALTTLLILTISHARQMKNPAYAVLLTPVSNEILFPQAAEAQKPTLPPLEDATLEVKNLFGAGELQTEFIQIQMIGKDTLWLTDWSIEDEDHHRYVFPRLQLNNGRTINVYTKIGVDSVPTLYWGMKEPLWTSGETLRILDSAGSLRVEFPVP